MKTKARPGYVEMIQMHLTRVEKDIRRHKSWLKKPTFAHLKAEILSEIAASEKELARIKGYLEQELKGNWLEGGNAMRKDWLSRKEDDDEDSEEDDDSGE